MHAKSHDANHPVGDVHFSLRCSAPSCAFSYPVTTYCYPLLVPPGLRQIQLSLASPRTRRPALPYLIHPAHGTPRSCAHACPVAARRPPPSLRQRRHGEAHVHKQARALNLVLEPEHKHSKRAIKEQRDVGACSWSPLATQTLLSANAVHLRQCTCDTVVVLASSHRLWSAAPDPHRSATCSRCARASHCTLVSISARAHSRPWHRSTITSCACLSLPLPLLFLPTLTPPAPCRPLRPLPLPRRPRLCGTPRRPPPPRCANTASTAARSASRTRQRATRSTTTTSRPSASSSRRRRRNSRLGGSAGAVGPLAPWWLRQQRPGHPEQRRGSSVHPRTLVQCCRQGSAGQR